MTMTMTMTKMESQGKLMPVTRHALWSLSWQLPRLVGLLLVLCDSKCHKFVITHLDAGLRRMSMSKGA